VDSLFTKVPVDDAIFVLQKYLPILKLEFPLPINKFIELVKLCVCDNVFSVGDEFYRQKFGLSMGNPLSPILCNLFMEYFERELRPKLCIQPIFWYRYVDDIFSAWPMGNSNFELFFSQLNKLHDTIKFKVEWESDNVLPFLDVKVTKVNNKPVFSVYRKPTNSESYIHYFFVSWARC